MKTLFNNAKILIVDDQEPNIDVLKDFLEMQGYTNIITLTDSREVIGVVKNTTIDMILLDLVMPYMSGFEIIEQLRQVTGQNEFQPVLVLTADMTEETKQAVIRSGAHDFLLKPFDLSEVGLRIRNLLFARKLWLQLDQQNLLSGEKIIDEVPEKTKQNNAKDEIYAKIIHDVKNPFSALIGTSDLLKRTLDKGSPDEDTLRKFANRLYESSVCGLKLLENLVEWFQLQSGKLTLNGTNENLSQIITEAIETLRPAAEKKQVRLNVRIPEKVEVFVNKKMIREVVKRLMTNAIKYTPANGEVTVSASTMNDEVEVAVTDNGIGIEEGLKENIFNIDKKFSCPGTEGERGTGMGLLLCHEYIKLHHGKIWFNSKEGEGSSFYFALNLSRKE